MNSFGEIYRLTTFGESHGSAIGGVIDGMPAGIEIDIAEIQKELDRRKPGQSELTTSRKEDDCVELLSGIFEGKTTGTPIGFIVRNKDHRSDDYSEIKKSYRPSHADYTYDIKYGFRDYRGGGRSSARETVSRVVGGALAKQALKSIGISIVAYTSQVGDIVVEKSYDLLDFNEIEKNAVRCPDQETSRKMHDLIMKVKSEGDTIGGTVSCVVKGCPAGLGEPVFGKMQARLASAIMSINAAKGFDYGTGFTGLNRRGSEIADTFEPCGKGKFKIRNNFSGGIQGGITNGEDIYFRVAFKPVATLLRDIETIDSDGNHIILHAKGRHDPCVLPRAVPIVEAMTAMTVFDCYLQALSSRL